MGGVADHGLAGFLVHPDDDLLGGGLFVQVIVTVLIITAVNIHLLAAHADGVGPGVRPRVGDLPVCFAVRVHGLVEHQPEDQGELYFLLLIDVLQHGPDLLREGGVFCLRPIFGAAVDPGLVHRQVDGAQAAVGDGEGRPDPAGELASATCAGRIVLGLISHLVAVVLGGNVEDVAVLAIAALRARVFISIQSFIGVLVPRLTQIVLDLMGRVTSLVQPHRRLHQIHVVGVKFIVSPGFIHRVLIQHTVCHPEHGAPDVVLTHGDGVGLAVRRYRLVRIFVVQGEGHRLPVEGVAVVQPGLADQQVEAAGAAAVDHNGAVVRGVGLLVAIDGGIAALGLLQQDVLVGPPLVIIGGKAGHNSGPGGAIIALVRRVVFNAPGHTNVLGIFWEVIFI